MNRLEHAERRLKLRQLEILLTVAQSGSMAKAAEHLAITQPVISKSIAELENTLGVRLFDRTSQGVEATSYGRALAERSIAIFNDLRTSMNELDYLSDPTAGQLRIGSTESVAVGLLSDIIDRLSRQYPRWTFEVMLGSDLTELPHHRELRARNIDLIIGRLPRTLPDDMEAITLYDEQPLILAAAHNPLTKRRKVELAELVNEPWCGPSFDIFPWSLIGDAFRAKNLDVPRNVVRVRSILARNGLLATGRFLTILSKTVMYFGANPLSLKRVPVDLTLQRFSVGIITLKNRTPTPVAQPFIECAREVVKPYLKNR
jgi:DNA-binding transcriptional LysR family regulator